MRTVVTLCLALGLPPAEVATEPTPYHFSKPIVFEKRLTGEEIVAIPLDSDVCAATREGFPDIRLSSGSGAEVPFLIRKVTESRSYTTREKWRADDLALEPPTADGLKILLSLAAKDRQPEGIRLVTPLRNYSQRVRVFGRTDDGEWMPLVADASIFDYSEFMDVSNQEIPLPRNAHRHFRIELEDVTAERQAEFVELTRRMRGDQEADRFERLRIDRRPFRIDRIEFWADVTREHAERDRQSTAPVAEFDVREDTENQQTHVEIRTRREPVVGFVLQTTSRNFSRPVIVELPESQGVRTEWRQLATATFTQIDFRHLHGEQLSLSFPEQRRERYRLVISNGDSAPLEITGVTAESALYQAIFFASPEATYSMFYGSESAAPWQGDMAPLSAVLQRDFRPVTAKLGEQVSNPLVAKPSALAPSTLLNNPIFLGTIIVLLVVALGWALYNAGRRIAKMPQ